MSLLLFLKPVYDEDVYYERPRRQRKRVFRIVKRKEKVDAEEISYADFVADLFYKRYSQMRKRQREEDELMMIEIGLDL